MYEGSLSDLGTIKQKGFLYSEKYGDKVIGLHNKRDYFFELNFLLDSLLDFNRCGENISLEYLKGKVTSFLIDCFFTKTDERHKCINKFYEDLKKELRDNLVEYTVPLLIENLSFDSEMFVGDVKFVDYSPENRKKLLENSPIESHIPDIYQPEPKNIEKTLDRMKQVKSIGITKVTSIDFYKALEEASEKVEEALNVVRLFNINSYFGIFGGYNRPIFHEVIAINAKTGFVSSSTGWDGDIIECKFSADELKGDAKKAFENICAILKKGKESREEMENKLLIAINIFGDIQKSIEIQHNISKMFTALETLLVFNRFENKGDNIAERAVLINHISKEERIEKHELINKMYNCRNDLVHSGSTDFKRLQYDYLLVELLLCILNIAKHIDKYPKQENWEKIIKDAKDIVFETKLIFQ